MKASSAVQCSLVFLSILVSAPRLSLAHPAADEMSAAAARFLESLSADQKAKATYPLGDAERLNWHFIPKDRNGLPLKAMSPEQRQRAHALLASGLSRRGFDKVTNIISLELILRDLERNSPRMNRDPELYYFTIFGAPGPKNTWAWRVEGHHLSVNFTVVRGEFFSGTPSFLGANPAEVRTGPRKGLRVLAAEEDLARQLVQSLDPEQRKLAIIEATAPRDIVTGAEKKAKSLGDAGLGAGRMTLPQRELLSKLLEEYLNRNRPDLAADDLKKIRTAGLDKVLFAWAGSTEPGQGHYYRVQGPTFLLEYDNTQNEANHIHAVWRDFENDFGDDILRRHYQQVPHEK